MKYNHNYTMTLSIGFSGAEREETVNPAEHSTYSEEEWNALSEKEQQEWLNSQAKDWAHEYIEIAVMD